LSGIWSIWIIAFPSFTGIWVLIQALLTDNHISIFNLGYVHETMGDSHDERTNAGKLGSDEHLGENLYLTPITFRVFPR